MPEVDPQHIEKTIKAIHDIAIMLTGASEYVCEGTILKRFSQEIEVHLERLQTDIASLQEEFPGKVPEDLKPDSSLSRIRDFAKMLKGDNADIVGRCRSGDLGDELNATTLELRGLVEKTLDTLGGRVTRLTVSDRITDYRGRVKSSLLDLSSFVSYKGKVILPALVVAILAFVYLFLTMESEEVWLSSIQDDLAFIEKQRDTLRRQTQEYRQIRAKVKSFERKELVSQRKIEFLNLSKEERRIKELLDKTAISIETRERAIAEKNKKVEEIRKKPFFQKLLRR